MALQSYARAPGWYLDRFASHLHSRVHLVWAAAAIAHEANRAYCRALGDDSQLAWTSAPRWQAESALTGAWAIANGETTAPEQSHEGWMRQKLAEGWVYGEKKDAGKQTHPCLVPFSELSPKQQLKDLLFFNVVTSVISGPPPAWNVARRVEGAKP